MKWFTVKEAAESLRVAEETITKRLRDGRFPHAKKNGKWLIPECCIAGHTQDEETPAEETAAETIQVEGIGLVRPDADIDELQRKKAKALLKRQISEIEAGYVTTEEVDAFRTQQANLNERDKASIARERDLADRKEAIAEKESNLTDRQDDLDDREERCTAVEAELVEKIVAVKKVEGEQGEFFRKYDCAVALADETQAEIMMLNRFVVCVRDAVEKTVKGARPSLNAKDAVARIWKDLSTHDRVKPGWAVDANGYVLVYGKPVPNWYQEEQFKIDHPELTIEIDSSKLNISKPQGDKDD